MRNIFLKKSNTKYGGEDSPRPFYKKSKIEHISGSTAWNVVQFVFIVCPSGCVPEYTKTKAVITCFDFIKSFFQKQKEFWIWSSCLTFCMVFEEIYFSQHVLLTDQISLLDCR